MLVSISAGTRRVKGGSVRSGTQVLDRAVGILDAIARSGRITLTDLSAEIALPLSTTQRLVTALAAHGFVDQGASGSGYSLGGKLRLLAAQVDASRNLTALARPIMEELVAQTKEDTFLAVLSGRYAMGRRPARGASGAQDRRASGRSRDHAQLRLSTPVACVSTRTLR